MMEIKVLNRITINCKPDELFVISKDTFVGFVIEVVAPKDKPDYDFVIFEGVKAFDRNQFKKETEIHRLTSERDALVKAIDELRCGWSNFWEFCKNYDEGKCETCDCCQRWEWRGVNEEKK